MTRTLLLLAAGMLALPCAAKAQSGTADSTFLIGDCPTGSAALVKWDEIVTAPEQPARLLAASFPMFPAHLRRDGYNGRVVLAMAIDTAGRVMPGTVSIGESTDAALSAWACTIAFNLRFTPALVAGKPVNSIGQQPLSYNARVIDRRR
jgi:outer membrane biosynthesis protein TonB